VLGIRARAGGGAVKGFEGLRPRTEEHERVKGGNGRPWKAASGLQRYSKIPSSGQTKGLLGLGTHLQLVKIGADADEKSNRLIGLWTA